MTHRPQAGAPAEDMTDRAGRLRGATRGRPAAALAEAVVPRWRIATLLPTAGRTGSAAAVAVSVLRGLLPVAFAVSISAAVGRIPEAVAQGIGSPSGHRLQLDLAAAAVALLLQQVLEPVQNALGEVLAHRVDGAMHDRLVAASLGSEDLTPLEDQRVLDLLEEATRELESAFRTPGSAFAGLIALIARYVQLTGFCVVVGVLFAWPAALALAAVALMFRYGQRGGLRRYARVIRAVTPIRREAAYLRELALGAPAAKEIRVFGLRDWLTERHRSVHRSAMTPVWAERRRIYLRPYLGYLAVALLAAGAALAALGAAAARREVSLADLALTAQAALALVRLGDFYPEADTQTQYGMTAADAIARFERAVAAADTPGAGAATAVTGPGPAPRIEFRKVVFRYPGAAEPVFDGLDLTLEPGVCTALVGVNGAGKTTIVKLLARLHRPGAGSVVADGTDIADLALDDWRRRLAVIFQDFTRYEVSAADNIGFGAVEALDDREAIRAAAEQAGILTLLDRLPAGLDTVLSRAHPGGTDLSGGQWQRVALARALLALRQEASVFVLDEPTAALDIRAEAAFFARFRELTRGRTSVLISHRFSSVRHADRIVVLERGRVLESGSHHELIAAGGRYAELFALQADRFADDRPTDATPTTGRS
ncbi:ATP-binding cassette domain-containing protein [Kitasatospora sp. NBC_00315]|uniref:ATP-binding cassette domain-containing protein n=1 Tax=Kitasatospora sp. NBC_00315 TaxID=2975963 RepID=UPI0032547331